jgi:hypothetical protein
VEGGLVSSDGDLARRFEMYAQFREAAALAEAAGIELTDEERDVLAEADRWEAAAEQDPSLRRAVFRETVGRDRARVAVLKERRTRADEAWEARQGKVRVEVRCPAHGARAPVLASVWASPLGFVWEASIDWQPWDLPHPPPWLVNEIVRRLPVEQLLDDVKFADAMARAQKPIKRDAAAQRTAPPIVVRDLVDLDGPTFPDAGLPTLYARCGRHPQPPESESGVLDYAAGRGFAVPVDRAEIGKLAYAARDGRTRVLVV